MRVGNPFARFRPQFLGGQFQAELFPCPDGQFVLCVILFVELAQRFEVFSVDQVMGRFGQLFDHLMWRRIAQLRVFQVDAETGHRPGGQALDVPVARVDFIGHVFADALFNVLADVGLGVGADGRFDLLEAFAAKLVRVDVGPEDGPRRFGGPRGDVFGAEVTAHGVLDRFGDVVEDQFLDRLAFQHRLARGVEGGPLVLHHLVVFEQALANLEVALLDLGLGLLDALGHPAVFDRVILLHAEHGQRLHRGLAGEHLHQVVFHGDEEPRAASVALAAGPSA